MTGKRTGGLPAGAGEESERFHVVLTFRDGGPAVEGTWSDRATALEKLAQFIGSHGSVPGTAVVLWRERSDGRRDRLRTWTESDGLTIHDES
ncbi:hypothetical protein ABT354_20230 [Streptomyces sp. NPDC000594]|uniref:hypothetical protein n=1 Tax=Streptomyces sp. NPDC000594 TaxID=3154261 RepID=UPI003332300C